MQYPESVPPLQALKHAQALKAEGKWTEAIQELTAVLPRMERLYGENHLNTSHVLNHLGLCYFNVGQYAKAEPLYQRRLRIREARLGPNHPKVA